MTRHGHGPMVGLTLILALLLGACGGDDDAESADSSRTSSSSATTETSTSESSDSTSTSSTSTSETSRPAPAVLASTLRYTRTGGIAGFHDELTISPGGQAHLTNRTGAEPGTDFLLTQREYDAVATTLEQSDFMELPADSGGGEQIADAFNYRISYAGKEVTTQDTFIPPQLQPLLTELQAIVEAHQPA